MDKLTDTHRLILPSDMDIDSNTGTMAIMDNENRCFLITGTMAILIQTYSTKGDN